MSREVTLTVKHTCNECGKYESYTERIANRAEISKPSNYPPGWVAVDSDHHEVIHYCYDCSKPLKIKLHKEYETSRYGHLTDEDLEAMNKRLERSARGN